MPTTVEVSGASPTKKSSSELAKTLRLIDKRASASILIGAFILLRYAKSLSSTLRESRARDYIEEPLFAY